MHGSLCLWTDVLWVMAMQKQVHFPGWPRYNPDTFSNKTTYQVYDLDGFTDSLH